MHCDILFSTGVFVFCFVLFFFLIYFFLMSPPTVRIRIRKNGILHQIGQTGRGMCAQNMYLLTEWEGRTGKYLARGHSVRTECAMTENPTSNWTNWERYVCTETTFFLRNNFIIYCSLDFFIDYDALPVGYLWEAEQTM